MPEPPGTPPRARTIPWKPNTEDSWTTGVYAHTVGGARASASWTRVENQRADFFGTHTDIRKRFGNLGQRSVLDLPHAFGRDSQFFGDDRARRHRRLAKPITLGYYAGFAIVQASQRIAYSAN